MKSIAQQFIDKIVANFPLRRVLPYFVDQPNCRVNGRSLQIGEFVNEIQDWNIAFSDLQLTLNETLLTENAEVISWIATGKHTGIYRGVLPSHKDIQFSGIFIFKTIAHKISSITLSWDSTAILEKLNEVSQKSYTPNDFSNDFAGPAKEIYELVLNSRIPPSGLDQLLVNTFRRSMNQVPINYQPPIIPKEDKIFTNIAVTEIVLDTKPHRIRALLYKHTSSDSNNKPLLLYFHGGGWIMLSPENYDVPSRKLALTADVNILSIDYRLLPEHSFPAPYEDCLNAYQWLLARGLHQLSLHPNKLLIGGDSCGGTMAAGVILKMHDEKNTLPDGAILFSPLTDMEFEKYSSFQKKGRNNLFLSTALGGFQKGLYLPYQEWNNPYYSPMLGDLSCFPPTFISAGGDDPLVDDNKAFATKLSQSNVEVDFFLAERLPHDHQMFVGLSPGEQQVYDAIAKFVSRLQK